MKSERSAMTAQNNPNWRRTNGSAPREGQGRNILHRIATYYKDVSAEHEILLELLGKSNQERLAEFQSRAARIDWHRLFAITPPDLCGYLGYKLNHVGLQSQCPRWLFEDSLNARRATAAQWLRFRFELRHLVDEFARHDVDFLMLKGTVLAFLAYPDSSLRSVSDIDILVRSDHLAKALECVFAAGFECPERYAHPENLLESALPGEQVSLPLEKPGTRALIEVHTQLESAEPWFRVSIGQIWKGSQAANLDGLRVRVPDQHEFLFHLILHLARGHLFSLGLRPLLDIHLWVEFQGERLDWNWIASECVRRGYGDWAHLTLKIVCDTFRTQIPPYFFEHVPSPPALDRLQRLAYEQIWADRRLDSLVPPRLIMVLSQRSVTGAIFGLLRRVRPARPENGSTVPPLKRVESAGLFATFRRMLNDFSVKTPQYVRAWRKGRLRWSSLQEATRLAKGRIEIKQTIAKQSNLAAKDLQTATD
jgi:Uncharacterised nucleotidyltransferase